MINSNNYIFSITKDGFYANWNHPWCPVFDGDDKDKKDGDDKDKKDGDDKDKKDDKSFTQDDVNNMLAKDRKKYQDAQKVVIEELEALKTKSTMTADDRKELEGRIETMKDELLTKDELASKEKQKVDDAHKTVVDTLTVDRNDWKNRYTNSTIDRAITDAAHAEDAYTVGHILAILKPETRMVEELDEGGKPTGRITPKVKFADTDSDGKPVMLDLTPSEAVKRMKDIEKHQVLFRGTGVGGLGGNTRKTNGKLDVKKTATDARSYREKRKNGEITFN